MKSLRWLIVFLISGLVLSIGIGFGFSFTMQKPKYEDEEQAGLNQKVIIRFSHVVAESTPKGLAVARFAELVRQKTNGMVEIRVYPNATLYNDATEFNALQQDQVEMIAPATSKLSARYPAWMVMDLPYAFRDERMVGEAMDGPLGKLLFQAINDPNVKGLALWDNGFKQMTSNEPLRNPDDFKGKTFRIMASPVLRSQFTALGAQAESYGFDDLYRQLEMGSVEGEENTLSNIYSKRLYQVQKHMDVSNHGYLGYIVLINKTTWNRLSDKQRQAIQEAMTETTAWVRHYAHDINNQALAEMKNRHLMTIHMQTDTEKQAWQRAFSPLYDQYKDIIGEQVLTEWRKLSSHPY
ncbi:DctP family TRAP transporter solute-binding subunit [Aneurinibacillus uraniidurans]|uniref:DctP family TRAP transporter solute-binding subunit n=1 Tax=Aneurinibacillus uraniidurans TaxID=2966586 RepID=UPI00234B315B|nr:DctP family TRAP transporter solute-binding subunit [Aneurinibacillus sp. B1]WCN38736.1 DctP family TRAP transporter solute-binding subunit [Aneurinibacillus sp. B1]